MIRIGTVFSGAVDQHGDESIQTKFFMLGVPLIPLESFYVLREEGNGVKGFAIPLHGKSVLLGYARWGTFIGLVISCVTTFTRSSYLRSAGDYVMPTLLAIAWVVTTFVLGRLAPQEKARRSLFKAATGVAAPPEYVPSHVAQGIHESLQANPLPENPAWVFVSAAYRARVESDPQAQALADATWAKLSSNSNVESTAPATSSLMADDAKRE